MDNNWTQHWTTVEGRLGPPKMKAGEQALPQQEHITVVSFSYIFLCLVSLVAWVYTMIINDIQCKWLHRWFKEDPQIRHVQSLRDALGHG